MYTLPKSQIIVGYSDFFPNEAVPNRLDLIQGICKRNLIAEVSGLNYRLKPKEKKYVDYTVETQDRELFYFTGRNQDLYKKYGDMARKFIGRNGDFPLIFTRQTCLFALEEIVHADIPTVESFSMRNSWEALLKYLLTINAEIAKIRKDQREEMSDDGKATRTADKEPPLTFEDINARIVVLNELNINSDQLYVPYRGYQLLDFMTHHAELGTYAVEFLEEAYDTDSRRFIFDILGLYLGNNTDGRNNIVNGDGGLDLDTSFMFFSKNETKRLFHSFSKIIANSNPETLLSIRKYPFYDAGDAFYLMDNTMLLEKCYSQFINDFWFDKVKPLRQENGKAKYDVRFYRAVIGSFFESYLDQSIRFMMENATHFKVKSLAELILKLPGGEVEFTDFYVRYNNKVFLGEAKSTGIYDKEKYSGELSEFYKDGREQFFNSFGMKQIVNAVGTLREVAAKFDSGFPEKGTVKVFPAIVINEKALQTPLMAQVFNNRFQELVKDLTLPGVKLAPLTVLHISDFENMEETVNRNPSFFWRMLERHALNREFMPPFYNTLNRANIRPDYSKPSHLYVDLINEFSVADENL